MIPPFDTGMMPPEFFSNANVGGLGPSLYNPYYQNSNMFTNFNNGFNEYQHFPMTPSQMFKGHEFNQFTQFNLKKSDHIPPQIQTPKSKYSSNFSEISESSFDNLEENKLLEPLFSNNYQNQVNETNLYARNNYQPPYGFHKSRNSLDHFEPREYIPYNQDPYYKVVHKEPKPYEKEIEIKERERREIVFQEVEMEIEIPQPPKTQYKEEVIDKTVWVSQPPKKVKVREIIEKEVLIEQPPIKKIIKEKVKVPYAVEQPTLRKKVYKRIPREIIYKYPTQKIRLIKEVRPYNPPDGEEKKIGKGHLPTDPDRKINLEFSSIPDEREPESENIHHLSLNSTPDNSDFIV